MKWKILDYNGSVGLYGCTYCGHLIGIKKPVYPYCPYCGEKVEEDDVQEQVQEQEG